MRTYKVSEVTKKINDLIDEDKNLSAIAVEGEVSNFKLHTSGMLYFSLKDDLAKINCVMFQKDVMNIDFIPKDGMHITAFGKVALYEKTSACQLYVSVLISSGVGILYDKYNKLLKELEMKGYFAAEHKKALPLFPKKVAVLTSPTGAVIHDILTTLRRRNPAVEIILCPCSVQGSGAEIELANTIEYLNKNNIAEVIILARGGGSIEELWAFNEKILADAIYSSKIPIISAIGHETDYTIADFTADLRAATPTAAAELVSLSSYELLGFLKEKEHFLYSFLDHKICGYKEKIDNIKKRDALSKDLSNISKQYKLYIENYDRRLKTSVGNLLTMNKMKLENLKKRVENNDILTTLNKGYALVYTNDFLLKDKKDIEINSEIDIKLSNFSIKAKVIEIKGESYGK
jgi:exodeoxyribonuclease VII large subunit